MTAQRMMPAGEASKTLEAQYLNPLCIMCAKALQFSLRQVYKVMSVCERANSHPVRVKDPQDACDRVTGNTRTWPIVLQLSC